MALLVVVAMGLLSLSAIEFRKSAAGPMAMARMNARLAMMQAIGQLQRTMGPDQRVTAAAEILRKPVQQPQWTGVWRTTLDNGDPFLTRDDLAGGLSDARSRQAWDPAAHVMEWLVSGTTDPNAPTSANDVQLFTADATTAISAPKIAVQGSTRGHIAWWTGDLGVRANLATRDPRSAVAANRDTPADGGIFRVMASQSADLQMMDGGKSLEDAATKKLVSPATLSLAGVAAPWGRDHALDFTTDSYGVLADVANGGLKRDLTAYFERGEVSPFRNLPGLRDTDPLIGEEGPAKAGTRYAVAGPRFGLLRDWARLAVPFASAKVAARLPDIDASAGKLSAANALANEKPVKLAGNQRAGLQPVLVEASNFTQISCYASAPLPNPEYQLRQMMYPRVVLWNPYNCELKFERAIVMLQGNGRQEMITENVATNGVRYRLEWLCFEGGRSTGFVAGGDIMSSNAYNDPYMGSYFYSIPATTFGPGECLVFSASRAAEYDGLSDYRPGGYNLNNNELSCTVAPDPAKSYYVSATDIGGGMTLRPVKFWYGITAAWSQAGRVGVENQADDTRAILKHVEEGSTIHFEDFDKLPQLTVLSASLQYGAGREPRVQWNKNDPITVELLDASRPRATAVPNVRTREGIRLRWFDEHPSNLVNSGPLTGSAHFEDALLGNWNPRASFVVRSPWENVAGTLPKTGTGGGPWFFGAYTRDLYDQAVSWNDQMPVFRKGRYHGNPFGPPQEGADRYVLFDVPRTETGLISLGQLQHAKLSEMIWHPSFAVGNSLVDPRLGKGGFKGLASTAAVSTTPNASAKGGFGDSEIGWSSDAQRSGGKDDWAATARALLANVTATDNVVYDLSYEVNRKLWDRYFLSSGSAAAKKKFLESPTANPLPNGRMALAPATRATADETTLGDFHQAAYHLLVDGAFNVNSTRVEAWKALLGSTRKSGFGADPANVPFPRVLNPPGGAWHDGDPPTKDSAWAGYRELTPAEIDKLAVAIVAEVKLRGPFLSLADFVNRRLAEDETGKMGALQAAIERANLNSSLVAGYPLHNQSSLPDYRHPDHLPDATRLEQTLKPASKAWGAPGYLTQADVLQVIGPALSARSDSFVIRAYGDSVDALGNVQARAWCEAVVQRTPQPLDPDESGLNPRLAGQKGDFGRTFVIKSFRWLAPGEI